LRVLGSTAGYVKYGLDPQEADLRDGKRPTPGKSWGVEPKSLWGRIGAGGTSQGEASGGESPQTGGGSPVETVPGDYPAYYAGIATALRDGTPPPVTAHEAAAALDVLEAARRSAREGVTVEVSA
jgi:scyllo-inositol 2-dehydrogenase (NADP+)